MIQGLRIRIPTEDLKKHIDERHAYHGSKANGYQTRIDALNGLQAEQGVSNDPVTNMRAKLDEHQRKATFFGLLSDYLVPNETYELDTSDLAKLEYVSTYF